MWIIVLLGALVLYFYLKGSSKVNNLSSNESSSKFKENYSSSNLNKSKNYGRYSTDFSVTSLVDENEILIKDAIRYEKNSL